MPPTRRDLSHYPEHDQTLIRLTEAVRKHAFGLAESIDASEHFPKAWEQTRLGPRMVELLALVAPREAVYAAALCAAKALEERPKEVASVARPAVDCAKAWASGQLGERACEVAFDAAKTDHDDLPNGNGDRQAATAVAELARAVKFAARDPAKTSAVVTTADMAVRNAAHAIALRRPGDHYLKHAVDPDPRVVLEVQAEFADLIRANVPPPTVQELMRAATRA